ncbi:hypothetical protein N7457_001908 [Penicillium paradoxum]|uniref:uncharacterized protein n=1 Tax=Penicillium paradoxum TaxID=176176 RepID=UPI002547E6E9|nr:uncharacterized protein N7457_001908 [Penicillium paradoxum]KAJ5795309.1 hypothetical protein N7457_001908 [Penicillium paradoxum]
MRWLYSPLRHCVSLDVGLSRSRLFFCLGLAATLLLLSYQLILNQVPNVPGWTKIQGLVVLGDHFILDPVQPANKELVFAAMQDSNMSWVKEHLPDWEANIYRVDAKDEDGGLTVPVNKGNEAMVYLTYIIDRYWSLPEVLVFLHEGRYQWHVDNPLYDSVISISHLNLDFVHEAGYVNLRCAWIIGCPRELEPARYLRERPDDHDHPTAVEYPDRFMELFPRAEVPEAVGTPCCSQFALSKTKIHERSLEDYVRLRRWLLETELEAGISGRILEYSWHMIFDSDIEKQWVWRGLQLPEGWPEQRETA